MQSVNAAFTAEERDFDRSIAQNLQVSWHRQSLLGNRTFTIGVSAIGGNDIVGVNPGSIGSPGNYKYFDESAYVMSLDWERGYSMPLGGLTMAMASAILDNTSRRFTPRYMGGSSEISTAILPSRPAIINAGFNLGANITIPQFAGLISEQPIIDITNRTASIKFTDYISYFANKKLDQAIMFTGQRTDQVLTTLSSMIGMNTAEYDYDTGINIIPFGYFPAGTNFADIFGQLVEAENGHFYQDESGIFKFESRYHWQNSPYTQVQRVISTGQVIHAESPDQSHLINIVEINANVRTKQQQDVIFRLDATNPIAIPANSNLDVFVDFTDPVLALTTPTNGGAVSYYVANTNSDGSGRDISSNVSAVLKAQFANSAKFNFSNSSSQIAYVTSLIISGRSAKVTSNLYYRAKDDSSVTAFNEHPITINNDFISNQSWAASYAQMILNDFSVPENIQKITIKAFPELQLGDLVSWQGRYWRLFDIKTTLDPSVGFIQELTMLQRTINTYFRIGISTIGGSDKIAP